MTANETTKTAIIQALPWLMPPQGVIHVGIGAGTGPMQKWRDVDVKRALLIDANLPQLAWLNNELANHQHWEARQAILAAQPQEAMFHTANNPMESGLCAPSLLSNLWPNLVATDAQPQHTQTLDQLLHQTGADTAQYDWLCVDCLSALDIIRGAQTLLPHINIVWARAILQPLADQVEYGLAELEEHLANQGFKRQLIVEENHPALASVLFTRDWSISLYQLDNARLQWSAAYDAAIKLAEECETQNQQLAEALQDQTTLAAERLQQLTQALQARDELTNLAEQRIAQIQQLTAERDQQSQIATERQQQLDRLSQECESQSRQLQSRIEALTQANIVLDQAKLALTASNDSLVSEVGTLSQARDEHASITVELQSRIETLTQECYNITKRITDKQTQIEALTQANTVLEQEKLLLQAERDALANEAATLNQAKDQQAQLVSERSSIIEALTQERDSYADQANERQSQIEALSQTNTVLAQERAVMTERYDVLEREMAAARDEQTQMVIHKNNEFEQLRNQLQRQLENIAAFEAEISERDARQHMLNEEMIKAEAQIDLIKDVLLREPGL